MKFMEFYETAPKHDLTYSDVFLVPSGSNVRSRLDVSLVPGDGTPATIPIVSVLREAGAARCAFVSAMLVDSSVDEGGIRGRRSWRA